MTANSTLAAIACSSRSGSQRLTSLATCKHVGRVLSAKCSCLELYTSQIGCLSHTSQIAACLISLPDCPRLQAAGAEGARSRAAGAGQPCHARAHLCSSPKTYRVPLSCKPECSLQQGPACAARQHLHPCSCSGASHLSTAASQSLPVLDCEACAHRSQLRATNSKDNFANDCMDSTLAESWMLFLLSSFMHSRRQLRTVPALPLEAAAV